MANEALFAERLKRFDDAIALKEPDRVPLGTIMGVYPFYRFGSSWKDTMYNYEAANAASIKFHEEYEPDVAIVPFSHSGKADEIAGSTMCDWPGRPGTSVADISTYQMIEWEYLEQDEYPEMLKDYTGFMLRKYIPRAYSNLSGLSGISFNPSIVIGTPTLAPLYSPEALNAYDKLRRIGEEDAKRGAAMGQLIGTLTEMGYPPYFIGAGEAPFDVLSDYYRGTVGASEDLVECPEYVAEACELFADIQIASLQATFKDMPPVPGKRVFFPLHKGMDGFMNDEQYREIYWKPLRRIVDALVEMDVVPFLYSEGNYNSRLETMCDLPKGKCLVHFETVDMKRAKETVGQVACISGNLPIYLLEYGTKEQVVEETKKLLEICMPGGGYIFDTNGGCDVAKPENVEAMFETVREYGKY